MSVFLDYAARGRTDWWRYPLALLGLALGILVFAGGCAILILTRIAPPTLGADLARPTHPVTFFAVFVGPYFGSILLGFFLALWLAQDKRPGDVIGRWSWRLALLGAGVWFAVQTTGAFVDFLIAPHSFKPSWGAGTGALALSAFLGLAVQTFTEEFVFRGYLTQGLLLATRRPWVASAISGVIFGALHIANGIPQAVNAVFFGVATSMVAIRTGGIAFTFGLHFVNNLFGAVFVVSSGDVFRGSPGLFTQTTPQLMGWDVGVAAVALLGVLWFTRRMRPPEDLAPARRQSPASWPRST
jgi:membrane protease YdiL (CAAX protease family)